MGEIATVVGGSTPKSKEPKYWGGDIPWLAVSDLTGFSEQYISRGARSITEAGFDSCAVRMLPKNSIVFSSRAPIGYVAIAANPLCTSQGFKSFVLDDGVEPEYVYWYLKGAKRTAESFASGTTFKELSGKRAAQIPIPVAPPAEQRAIARRIKELMGSLSSGEDSSVKAMHLSRLFFQALTDGITEGHRFDCVPSAVLAERLREEREAAHRTRAKRYKEPALPVGSLVRPSGWELCSIDQVCDFVTDGDHNPPKRQASGIPHLTAKHVHNDRLHTDECTFISAADYDRVNRRCEPKAGDVVLTCVGTIGRVATVPPDFIFSPDRNLAVLRPLPSMRPRFLMFSLMSSQLQRFMASASGSTAQPHLYLEDLRALPIAVPPVKVQDAALRFLEHWRTWAGEGESRLRVGENRVKSLREAILWGAFLGQLGDQSHDRASAVMKKGL